MATKIQVATIMRAKQAGGKKAVPPQRVTSAGSDEPRTFWEGVLHRRSIEDSRQIVLIHARLRVLETPWYKPLTKRYWKRALAEDRKTFNNERAGEA